MFKIEKSVPAPRIKSMLKVKFPFVDLKPGESFFVPVGVKSFGTVKKACLDFNRKTKDSRIVYRKEGKEGTAAEGTRVWKIKFSISN